jgi:hypothetical protein
VLYVLEYAQADRTGSNLESDSPRIFIFLESPRTNPRRLEICRTGSGTGGSFQINNKLELGPYACSVEK